MSAINAPQLSRRRSNRREEILNVTADLLIEDFGRSISMAVVAKKLKISRTTIYEYFENIESLVASTSLREIRRFSASLAEEFKAAQTVQDGITIWMECNLRYFASSRHRVAVAFTCVALQPPTLRRLTQAHGELSLLLITMLRNFEIKDAERVASFIAALTENAAARIKAGAKLEAELAATKVFCLSGITR